VEKEFPYFSLNLVSVRTLSAFKDVYIYPLRKGYIFHDCCCDPRCHRAEVCLCSSPRSSASIIKIVKNTSLNARLIQKNLSRSEDNSPERPSRLTGPCCTNLIELQQTGQLCWDHQYSARCAEEGITVSRQSVSRYLWACRCYHFCRRIWFSKEGDIIVADNWSEHISARGKKLKAYLWYRYELTCIYLPSRFFYLNIIENCWERASNTPDTSFQRSFWTPAGQGMSWRRH
jgi:hypothetical protein